MGWKHGHFSYLSVGLSNIHYMIAWLFFYSFEILFLKTVHGAEWFSSRKPFLLQITISPQQPIYEYLLEYFFFLQI